MSDIFTPSAAQTAEDLVALIDQLMAHGSGHVNVTSAPGSRDITVHLCRNAYIHIV